MMDLDRRELIANLREELAQETLEALRALCAGARLIVAGYPGARIAWLVRTSPNGAPLPKRIDPVHCDTLEKRFLAIGRERPEHPEMLDFEATALGLDVAATLPCEGCRFWSDLVAQVNPRSGDIEALCLHPANRRKPMPLRMTSAGCARREAGEPIDTPERS